MAWNWAQALRKAVDEHPDVFILAQWRREGSDIELPEGTTTCLSPAQAEKLKPHAVYAELLYHADLPIAAKAVGWALATHGNNSPDAEGWGKAFPSAPILAHGIGGSEATVKRAVKVLKRTGWIVVTRRTTPRGDISNAYWYAIPWDYECRDCPRPAKQGGSF